MSSNFIFKDPQELFKRAISDSSNREVFNKALEAENTTDCFTPYNEHLEKIIKTFDTDLENKNKKDQLELKREMKLRGNCIIFFVILSLISIYFDRFIFTGASFLLIAFHIIMSFGARFNYEKGYYENVYSGLCEIVLYGRIYYETLYNRPEISEKLKNLSDSDPETFNVTNILNLPRITMFDCEAFIRPNISSYFFNKMQNDFRFFSGGIIAIRSIIEDYDQACAIVKNGMSKSE